MSNGQAEVPPTPEAASAHEQPRAVGRSGLMTAQTGPDEEADEASTTPGVMARSTSMRVIFFGRSEEAEAVPKMLISSTRKFA